MTALFDMKKWQAKRAREGRREALISQIREATPLIVLTDCTFDFTRWWWPRKANEPTLPPITRERVEAFLQDPWSNMSMYELAKSWLVLDDKLRTVQDDRDWWMQVANNTARKAEERQERVAVLTERLEQHLEPNHFEPS